MVLRTCLLVSDDPDDHVMFTEVLHDISSDIVLINVMDALKAFRLLSSGRYHPDYLIVDASNAANDVAAFEQAPELERIPLVVYGEFPHVTTTTTSRAVAFLGNDLTYSRLRTMLAAVIKV